MFRNKLAAYFVIITILMIGGVCYLNYISYNGFIPTGHIMNISLTISAAIAFFNTLVYFITAHFFRKIEKRTGNKE